MNPSLAAVAAITVAGGVLAVSTRDARTAALGILIVLIGSPLIADPWPSPLATLVRIVAALLAIRFLAIGLRGVETTGGSRIGWPADALLASAGAVVGFGSHGLGATAFGPAEAQAAGVALLVLAAAPLVTGRDVLRLGIGALLLLVGASLIRTGLDASAGEGEQLVSGLLTVGIGGAVAVIGSAARAAGGTVAVDAAPPRTERRPPDAHRPVERAPGATRVRRQGRPGAAE